MVRMAGLQPLLDWIDHEVEPLKRDDTDKWCGTTWTTDGISYHPTPA